MIVYFKDLTEPYIIVMDLEYDQGRLIQFAGIMFKRIGENLYQIYKSLNMYVKQESISSFTSHYTHISESFLKEHGVTEEEAVQCFYDDFLKEIDNGEDVIFVSHGIHQDAIVMKRSGLDIDGFKKICTYNMAKRVLHRERDLKLSDVLRDSGAVPICEHNAYADALATVNVLSFLLKLQGDEK